MRPRATPSSAPVELRPWRTSENSGPNGLTSRSLFNHVCNPIWPSTPRVSTGFRARVGSGCGRARGVIAHGIARKQGGARHIYVPGAYSLQSTIPRADPRYSTHCTVYVSVACPLQKLQRELEHDGRPSRTEPIDNVSWLQFGVATPSPSSPPTPKQFE